MELRGIDVSAWQHNDRDHPQIDWRHVQEAGYTFAYVKATQGTGYVNPWLDSDVTLAQEAGLLVGAIHYAWPRPQGAEAEAAYALKNTDRYDLDLGVALELGNLGEMSYPGELTPWAQQFLAIVQAEHDDAPLLCDQWYFTQLGGGAQAREVWLSLDSDEIPPPPAIGSPPWCYRLPAEDVPGIAVRTNVSVIASPGGLNPPTDSRAPSPPVAAEPEPEAEEETTTE